MTIPDPAPYFPAIVGRLPTFLPVFGRVDFKHRLDDTTERRTIGVMGSERRKLGAIEIDRIFANAKVGANVVSMIAGQVGDGIRQRSCVATSEFLALPKLLHEARRTRSPLMNLVRPVMPVRFTLALVTAIDVRTVDARPFRIVAREDAMKLALAGRLLGGTRAQKFRSGVIVASDADTRELTVPLGVDRAFRCCEGLGFGKGVTRAASGHFVEKSRGKLKVDGPGARYVRRDGHSLAVTHRIAARV
jgi:hypothetical protein